MLRSLYFLFALAIALSLVMTGCGKVAEKTAEKAVEKAIEDASGEAADVEMNKDGSVEISTDEATMKVGGDYKWPEQLPADVPEFSYGKILAVTESSNEESDTIFVAFQGVKDDAFDKYKSELEGAGWEINIASMSNDGFLITATKEQQNLFVSFSNRSEDGVSGGVTYSKEKQ